MDKEQKFGMMEMRNMLEPSLKGKSMVSVGLIGKMDLITKVILNLDTLRAQDTITLQMQKNITKDNFMNQIWKEKGLNIGKMEGNMKVNLKKERKKVKVLSYGQMEINISVAGKMGDSTA